MKCSICKNNDIAMRAWVKLGKHGTMAWLMDICQSCAAAETILLVDTRYGYDLVAHAKQLGHDMRVTIVEKKDGAVAHATEMAKGMRGKEGAR